MFRNRQDAGLQLAKKLDHYRDSTAIILALPRGGVVVAHEVMQKTHLPLDIVVVRKIGYPEMPEYAVGAVDAEGNTLWDEGEVSHIPQVWKEQETKKQLTEAKRRISLYRGDRSKIKISGRVVIIIDDGVATGLTMHLAIRVVQKEHPARIVVAVPVIPDELAIKLESEHVEVVALERARNFRSAVGSYYQEFEQVSDEEVVQILSR